MIPKLAAILLALCALAIMSIAIFAMLEAWMTP